MAPPVIMEKDQQTILATIKGKVPHYTPEWTFGDEKDPGVALSRIFAYMAEISVKRLNSAPQKHFLSFLETINASLIPAQPSRVPLTFKLSEGTPENVLIPAATQASAAGPDGKPVLFETERNIMATPANLVSVVSVIKESKGIKDSIFDHTNSINGAGSTELFSGENQQEHVLYIGDKNLLNVKNAKIKIEGKWQDLEKLSNSDYVTWYYSVEEITEKKNDKEIKKINWNLLNIDKYESSPPSLMLKKITTYLFSWGEFSGLIEFLTHKLGIDWAKDAKIEKIDYGRTIRVYAEKNSLSIKLETINVNLKIDDDGTNEFIPKSANDAINVYDENNKFLFSWKDNSTLKNFLINKFDCDWVKTANIIRVNNGLYVYTHNKSISLERVTNKVNLKINDDGTDQFSIQYKNGKLEVYDKYNKSLFNWGKIPDEDKEKLKELLRQKYGINWIKSANITPSEDSKTITISFQNKSFSLTLGTIKVNLEIDNFRTYEFIAKYENGKVNVYDIDDKEVPNDEVKLNGFKSRWIKCKVNDPHINEVKNIVISNLTISSLPLGSNGTTPDFAFTNDVPINLKDPEQDVYPFGVKPQIFSTFYIASKDAFSKTGYRVDIEFNLGPGRPSCKNNTPQLSWEYWDGEGWRSIEKISYGPENNSIDLKNWVVIEKDDNNSECDPTKMAGNSEKPRITVTIEKVPEIKPTRINGKENYWIRIRLIGGDYGKEYKIVSSEVKAGCFFPPSLNNLTVSYECCDLGKNPEYVLTSNNLELKSIEPVKGTLKPLEPLPDEYPTVYFGFDRALKGGPFSLFISIDEKLEYPDNFRPRVRWKCKIKDGTWKELTDVLDETGGFTKSGVVQFVVSDEMIREKMLGSMSDLYWIRAEVSDDFFNVETENIIETKNIVDNLKSHVYNSGKCDELFELFNASLITEEAKKIPPTVLGFYLNSAWALQSKTITDEVIGSSNGEGDQEFHLLNLPVLNEIIWVNEFGTLTEEERKNILNAVEKKDENNNLVEFWISWTEVENFVESNEKDRHYIIDRASGELRFGDGKQGMVPTIGLNNIRATYTTGGGKSGNVGSGQISKLQSSIPFVDKVNNPIVSDGGTDTEEIDALIERAPISLKHRNRAVAHEDFKWLAKQASRKVAIVKVLPNFNAQGEFKTGHVTVVIVPQSSEPRPIPSPELRLRVKAFLQERCSNVITLNVIKPSYVMVSISALLATEYIDAIPVIEHGAKTKITEFLHPLTGGTEGKGWSFGSAPCISDIYSILENIEKVDYVTNVSIKLQSDVDSKVIEINETSGMIQLPEYALPYSGGHDINVQWKGGR